MFDNESEEFIEVPGAMSGHWAEDEHRLLYIVPAETDETGRQLIAECEGPDNAVMDAINAACREGYFYSDPDAVFERLGLTPIPAPPRRFDPADGYYHA